MISVIRQLLFPTGKDQSLETLPSYREMHSRAFKIAWPATVESVFVGLAGLVDTMMVSTLGTAAVAAVGLTNQPKFICLAFILSLNVGVTALISRRIGEKRLEEAKSVFLQSLTLSFLISLLVCGLSFLFARPFLKLAGARQDTIRDAVTYFRWLLIGQFFQHLCLTINTAQRCAGNSGLSMRTNICANVINVIANYLLIGGHLGFPALGVRGAAIATSLGNVAAFGMAALSLFSPNSFFQIRRRGSWRPALSTVKSLWGISCSAFLENACLRLGFFIYSLIVANLGTVMFATHQICMNITNLTFACFDGCAIAAAALAGRCLGARKPAGAEVQVKICASQGCILATIIFLGLVLFRMPLLQCFSADPMVLEYGGIILLIVAATAHIDALSIVFAGGLRGAGDTRFVAVISLISTTTLRPFLSWLLCYPLGLGLMGPWIGFLIDLYLRGILNTWRFQKGKWKQIKL